MKEIVKKTGRIALGYGVGGKFLQFTDINSTRKASKGQI